MIADEPAAVAETHISTVFFLGDRAVKVPKHLRTDVVDQSTPRARAEACRREVALNRRLAPDVYLGAGEVRGVDGEVWEHVVLMRRLPADRRLSRLVGAGPAEAEVRAVAQQVAAFHARAHRGPEVDAVATAEALQARWRADLEGCEPFAPRLLPAEALAELQARAAAYLAGRRPLLEARIAAGRIVDGHGDLLADDVFCLDDGPRVLDCLAFADELRWGDVVADVAFLAMDLERLGRPDLAALLLAEHGRALGEQHPPSLAHLYVAQRALVRAKVGALRADQVGERAEGATALLEQARSHLRQGEVRLVLVGGPPGAGTSTLARGLADLLDAAVLRSDELRKELAGVAAEADLAAAPDQGAYAPAQVDAVYDELLRRAGEHLGLGRSVVLDASWSRGATRRRAAATAEAAHARLDAVRADAPPEACQARVARRRARGRGPSDATPEVAAELAARFEPWPEATTVDTTGTKDASLAAARAALGLGDDVRS